MKLSVSVFNSCSDLPQELPDVIGFVGITPEIRKELESVLPQYSFFAMGTSAQYDGVQNPIAFRKDRFALHGYDHFWLSDTPDIESRGWDSLGCNRICLWAKLRDKQTDAFRPSLCTDRLRTRNIHHRHSEYSVSRQSLYPPLLCEQSDILALLSYSPTTNPSDHF